MAESRIPAIYEPATARCVTPVDNGEIGIAFDRDSGETVRLRLGVEDAKSLLDLLTFYLFPVGDVVGDAQVGSVDPAREREGVASSEVIE